MLDFLLKVIPVHAMFDRGQKVASVDSFRTACGTRKTDSVPKD